MDVPRIIEALQEVACHAPDRRIQAVDAAAHLERRGLLKDSAHRPGLPLRRLLREGRIRHAYKEGGHWWWIECEPNNR